MWSAAALLALASPDPGLAREPDAVAVSSNRPVALKLAETLNPKSTVQAFITRAAVDSLAIEFSKEPQLKKLEQTYPGLRDALLKRLPDALNPLVESSLPTLYSTMADRLLVAMDEPTMNDALAFAEGPVGKSFIGSATDSVIKNYLKKGPCSPSDQKQLAQKVMPMTVKDPKVASWAKAVMVISPALRAWVDEQHKIDSQTVGELVETIISEMVDREPT